MSKKPEIIEIQTVNGTEFIDLNTEVEVKVPKKQRKPPVRKGNNKLLATEKKPSGDLPAMVEDGTRAWTIATELRAGTSLHDISEKYGISMQMIRDTMAAAISEIYEEAGPISLNYAMITITRLEYMINTLWKKLVKEADGIPNDTLYARLQSLFEQQARVYTLIPRQNNPDQVFEATISSNSSLYKQGNKDMNDMRIGSEPKIAAPDLDNVFASIPGRVNRGS